MIINVRYQVKINKYYKLHTGKLIKEHRHASSIFKICVMKLNEPRNLKPLMML